MISLQKLAEQRIIIGDGASGTVLHQRLPRGSSLDLVAIDYPDELLKLHIEYIKSGSMVIQTHTFGTSKPKLAAKNVLDRFEEINSKAVKIAREAREVTGCDVLIGGSIGPAFQIADNEEVKNCQIFTDQAVILEERGCDLFVLETFPTIEELSCAINAIRQVSSLPIVAQITVPDEWSPSPEGTREHLLEKLLELPALFIGLNCGSGPDEYLEILDEWGKVDEYHVAFQPNAGVPVRRDGRYIYPAATPEYFAYFARLSASQGVGYLGGCCGTTPAHIMAISEAVKDISPRTIRKTIEVIHPSEKKEEFTEAESNLIARLEDGDFTTVIQLDPPKGSNIDYLVSLASLLKMNRHVSAVDINANPLGRLHFDSLWLASIIEQKVGLETIPHITPRDASLMGLESQLLGAWYSGIKNLLVITGDPSQMGDYPGANDVYQTDSIGLVKTVNKLNQAKDWGGSRVGDPPSFVIGVAVNPGAVDRKREIEKYKEKIEAGARFAMSQVIFSWDIWESFWKDFGGPSPIPVMVGIWPLTSLRLAMRIHNEIPGIEIPEILLAQLENAGPSAREIGWDISRKLYEESRNYSVGAYLIAPYKRGESILQLLD